MSLRSIEYFLKVAEEGNITRAANKLYISQQALSNHIKRLEDEYQVTLFERKPVFRLTKAGESMVYYGQRLIREEAEMRAVFSDLSLQAKATLRFGISRLRADVFLPLIWQFYKPNHPNISIEVVNGNSKELDDLLQAGKIDLYVGIDVPSSPVKHSVLLATEGLQCCFTEGLLRRHYPETYELLLREFESGADLLKLLPLPLISVRQGNRLRERLDQYLMQYGKPEYVLECDQQNMVYELARQGAGVGLLSPLLLYRHGHDEMGGGDPFYSFPIRNDIGVTRTYMVYRSDYTPPQYLKDFISDVSLVFESYARTVDRKYSVEHE